MLSLKGEKCTFQIEDVSLKVTKGRISRYSHIVGNDISSVNSLAVMNEISLMRRQQKCLPHIKY